MGSKPVDSGTMKSASAGAQASDAALAKQATDNNQFSNSARAHLFGSGSSTGDFSGGTLSQFMDPNSLKVSGPTGTYGLQYNKAVENIAKQGQDARGTTSRYLASRGFGNGPSGFGADQERRATQAQTDTQGQAFTDFAGKSYQDALGNFWRSNDALSGQGTGALSASIAGNQAAAGNYANLYDASSRPMPSALGAIVGGGLSAGGQIGAAAMCPVRNSLITLIDGTNKPVQDLNVGDEILGIDGKACPVIAPIRGISRASVETILASGKQSKTSAEHTWALQSGGYQFAQKSLAELVKTADGSDTVDAIIDIGEQTVYPLEIGGSHTYLCDGIWSLS